MMKNLPGNFLKNRSGESRGAFSLVEVTLALGIVAFALVTLLGLLPIGLASSQEAISQTARTHILKQIAGDIGMMPLGDLQGYVAEPRYYDYDGKPVKQESDAVFEVNLQLQGTVYPGSDSISDLNQRFEQVSILIKRARQDGALGFRATLPAVNYYEQYGH